MRLFLALEIPRPSRDHIIGATRRALAQAEHGELFHAAWVCPENIHITVKFLGEVSQKQLPALVDSLESMELSGEPLLWADGLECFPPRGPVRVIAAGFGGDIAKLHLIHRSAEQACQEVGLEKEKRPYTPHATVLRARDPLESHDPLHPSLSKLLSHLAEPLFPGPPFVVKEVVLMRSEPTPTGQIYMVLNKFQLE